MLVVDQFEEVFTLCAEEPARREFLEALRVAAVDPDSPLRVVITLRADFLGRPLMYPRFAELLAERSEAVSPLAPDELEQAIRGPAERVGVAPEPGLVAQMIADVAHEPGALPLLQYTLTELFEHRAQDQLTLAAYDQVGGVIGSLSARAERILESLDGDGAPCDPAGVSPPGHPRRGNRGHPPPRAPQRTGRDRGRSGFRRRGDQCLRPAPVPHLRP